MTSTSGRRTIGVEEEFLLVDAGGTPRPGVDATVTSARRAAGEQQEGHDFARELKQQQVESGTAVCADLAEVAREVAAVRTELAAGATTQGLRLAALGTSPLPVEPTNIDDERAAGMIEVYGQLAQEMLACGCHVHVSVASRAEGVAVLDRIRPWLPVLTALTANSPYWQGMDTGYASYRSVVWGQLPTAGPYEPFGTADAYERAVQTLVTSGASLDRKTIYFDARLSDSFPTVEIRAADCVPTVADAVLLAALSRALVETAADEAAAAEPTPAVRMDLLRAARWRAARSGLSGDLIDALTGRAVPAGELVSSFVDHLRPSLDRYGDHDHVDEALSTLLRWGNGADRQRADFDERHTLFDVVDAAADRTVPEPAN